MFVVAREKHEEDREYLRNNVTPLLAKVILILTFCFLGAHNFSFQGLGQMYDQRPDKPLLWLADWLEENNPKDRSR